MTRLLGQLFEILKLGAAIALPERVNIVDVAQNRARCPGERAGAQVSQEPSLLEAPVNVRHSGFDELAKLKLVAVLGDLDGAQLARPIVDVLKQVSMDRAEVGKVETASGNAFGDALGDKFALSIVEACAVGISEPINENVRSGIDVGVVLAHSAASRAPFARI